MRILSLFSVVAILLMANAAMAQDSSAVGKFRGVTRGMINGKPHALMSLEGPGGRTIQIAVPNKNESRAEFDPESKLMDTLQELKSGDLVEISVEMGRSPRPTLLRSVKAYELKPGEDQPNGYVFDGTDEQGAGRNKTTVVQLRKMGQKISVSIPAAKGSSGDAEPDAKLMSDLTQFKEGDSVYADISGRTLISIEPYTDPQPGKVIKLGETEVDGHKIRSAQIDQDGKTLNVLVPGKANGRSWVPDQNVSRQYSRLKPGELIQFRSKEDGDKIWLRSIEAAPKTPLDPPPEKPMKKAKK